MATPQQHVWIDTDMGFDDLAAVLTVAMQPEWVIDGMTLVAGNAPLPGVCDNAQRSAHYFGWRFPFHVGADQPLSCALVTAQDILGADAMQSAGRQLPPAHAPLLGSNGVEALIGYLEHAQRPVTLLALGPLTNLALVLQEHPDLAPRIGQLMWMGGSAGPGNHTAAAEFNAAVDPEAVQVVLDQGVALQMVGLDACRQVHVHAADADTLRALGGDRAALLADLLLGYVRIASADTRWSRATRSPTTSSRTNDSPSRTATMPASWTNDGAHDVLYSISLPRSPTRPAGSTIQPRRQPVISQLFENELTQMTCSSRVAMSRNDGATAPPDPK